MVHVTVVKVGEVNTTRECFDAEMLIRSRWREPQLDNTTQVMLMMLLLMRMSMMTMMATCVMYHVLRVLRIGLLRF